jgi:hypothetical protein
MPKNVKKRNKNFLEVSKLKPIKEEEKFAFQFSSVQLNAILLFILAATFLISGASKLADLVSDHTIVKIWLFFTILSILILTLSVFTTIIGNAVAIKKAKRVYNGISLILFLLGAVVFFVSLILLLIAF